MAGCFDECGRRKKRRRNAERYLGVRSRCNRDARAGRRGAEAASAPEPAAGREHRAPGNLSVRSSRKTRRPRSSVGGVRWAEFELLLGCSGGATPIVFTCGEKIHSGA
jgi:hypothetical protein